MSENSSVAGVILCGGRGARMNGVNKGLADYRGRKLFEFAWDNLKAVTEHIAINTNTEADTYRALGFPVIGDRDYRYQGPLAGIYAGLTQLDSKWVAFAPCDQLALPERVYPALLDRAQQTGAAFAVTDQDMHPTCCVISRTLAPQVRQALDKSDLRLGRWMKQHASAVKFAGVEFANVNQLPA